MRLYLYGHDYKYAVEQMLLTLFPEERPEYPEGRPQGDRMELRLSRGERRTTATCALYLNGGPWWGRASAENSAMTGKLLTDRVCQRLLKNAIYRSALRSGRQKPAWGALTGVRPGKLMCALLRSEPDEQTALRRFGEEYDVSPERAALCLDTSRETLRAEAEIGEKDICLYVGIPFCPTRCAYCSFVSQSVEKSMKLIPPFLEALHTEIRATAAQVRSLGLRVISLYMGGGTPTTLSAEQLDGLCSALEREFDLSALREYTVEAGRPDTITREKLLALKEGGANRISVNPQTMSDEVLAAIGRSHRAEDIRAAYALAREVDVGAINMDLIAGLPADTLAGFQRTVEEVIALDPENITVHTLALKRGARLRQEDTPLPDGQTVAAMLDFAWAALDRAGYVPYYLYRQKFMSGSFENVGWCKPGWASEYNICMMEELHTVLSLGAGGVTKFVGEGTVRRAANPKYPQEYLQNSGRIAAEKAAWAW